MLRVSSAFHFTESATNAPTRALALASFPETREITGSRFRRARKLASGRAVPRMPFARPCRLGNRQLAATERWLYTGRI